MIAHDPGRPERGGAGDVPERLASRGDGSGSLDPRIIAAARALETATWPPCKGQDQHDSHGAREIAHIVLTAADIALRDQAAASAGDPRIEAAAEALFRLDWAGQSWAGEFADASPETKAAYYFQARIAIQAADATDGASDDALASWTLQGMYDDDRSIEITPGINGEVSVTVRGQEPVFLFAEDFMRVGVNAALDALAALNPTPREGGTRR